MKMPKKKLTQRDIDALRNGKSQKKEKKKKSPPGPPTRNAEEYKFAQVAIGDRKKNRSTTERKALDNIENLHRTPQNNIHNKRPVIFVFHKISRQGERNMYECKLPDGYYIIADVVQNRYGDVFRAYYAYDKEDVINPVRKALEATGSSYTEAVARLLGRPQFKNPHSVRWLNFYNLCIPHIHIPGNRNIFPKNPVEIPTQAWVNSLNLNPNLGETPNPTIAEQLKKIRHAIPANAREELKALLGDTGRI